MSRKVNAGANLLMILGLVWLVGCGLLAVFFGGRLALAGDMSLGPGLMILGIVVLAVTWFMWRELGSGSQSNSSLSPRRP